MGRKTPSTTKQRVASSLEWQPGVDRRLILTIAWVFAFFLIFFTQILPNAESQLGRMDVLLLLPDLFADLIASTASNDLSGWRFLPQRFDLILVASGILAAAWGWGNLIRRGLRVPSLDQSVERTVVAFGLGLSVLSLLTLVFGLLGWLFRPLFLSVLSVGVLVECVCHLPRRKQSGTGKKRALEKRKASRASHVRRSNTFSDSTVSTLGKWTLLIGGVAVGLFLLAMLLGAMLPSTDFDAREYHLEGPKEFFQMGRIEFLPHNVYTSFPFFTEMLSLLAMVLRGDWYWGALAGKAVLMVMAPLTAMALYAAGRRWFHPTVGWLAAFVYITTPWVYRISIIAYAEGGLTCYLFLSLLAALMVLEQMPRGPVNRVCLLTGLFAGSAMACKYTGVVQVVIPIGCLLLLGVWIKREEPVAADPQATERQPTNPTLLWRMVRVAAIYSIGVFITIGPWLIKNAVETGNPVYPLAYSVFGGRDWDSVVNARWHDAHSPHTYDLSDLKTKFNDVTVKSDWLSPLLFCFAPLAFLSRVGRRTAWLLWGYLAYLFFAWWLLTHRIDRFWVPMIPVVSLVAAVGMAWSKRLGWRITAGVSVWLAVLFNLGFITTPLCGYNGYLSDLHEARRQCESVAPGIAFLNQARPENLTRVLSVGEAQVFDARFPLVYNTVFDASIFQQWCAGKPEHAGQPDAELPMKSAADIRRRFGTERISHVLVSWQEIIRYRTTYKYADFVTPGRFRWLQEHGILGEDLLGRYGYREWESLSDDAKVEIDRWAPELRQTSDGKAFFIAIQIFPVLSKTAG